jgi:DNA polymerase III epsilon subunit-like protein
MIVVDVETTGLRPDRYSIVSIGAIDFENPSREFYRECRPWDGAEFDTESLAVNGFTAAQVTDPSRPSLEKTIGEFIAWALESPDRTLGGMNTFFDRDFLRSAAERYNMQWQFGHRVLDLHTVCWMHMVKAGRIPPLKYGRLPLTNDTILQYAGLPPEPKPHHGFTGAKMEAEAFSRLVRGTSLLAEFSQYPLPEYLHSEPSGQVSLF